MNVVGIIAEYNPFHNGHLWHLQQAKAITGARFSVAVMSGHFTQRGEAALFDKWRRAQMAVVNGVDLVIELPVVWSVRSAAFFASASIRQLAALGVVDSVCFGAETPDLPYLTAAADALTEPATRQHLRQLLQQGLPYAAAVAQAVAASAGLDARDLSRPNNILALEYLRALRAYAPWMTPVVIGRKEATFHDREFHSSYASAGAIRRFIFRHGLDTTLSSVIPPASMRIMAAAAAEGRGPIESRFFYDMIMYRLRIMSRPALAALPESGEGLDNKLAAARFATGSVPVLLRIMKSKRYPYTRLQRLLAYVLLGLTQRQLSWADAYGPQYIRVLAFNEQGRMLLKRMRQTATLPVVIKTARYLPERHGVAPIPTAGQRLLSLEARATDIYALAFPSIRQRAGGGDFTQSPLYIAGIRAQQPPNLR